MRRIVTHIVDHLECNAIIWDLWTQARHLSSHRLPLYSWTACLPSWWRGFICDEEITSLKLIRLNYKKNIIILWLFRTTFFFSIITISRDLINLLMNQNVSDCENNCTTDARLFWRLCMQFVNMYPMHAYVSHHASRFFYVTEFHPIKICLLHSGYMGWLLTHAGLFMRLIHVTHN